MFQVIYGFIFRTQTLAAKQARVGFSINVDEITWDKEGILRRWPGYVNPQDLFWLLQCLNCMCYFQFVPGLQEFKRGHKCRLSLPCKCDRVYPEEWRQHGISVPLPRLLFTDRVKISMERTGESLPLQQMVGNESNETTVSH